MVWQNEHGKNAPEREIEYIIAIDGRWIGKYYPIDPKRPYMGNFFSAKSWKRKSYAIKRAQQEHRKNKLAKIEVFETWGSGAHQRKVIKTYKK